MINEDSFCHLRILQPEAILKPSIFQNFISSPQMNITHMDMCVWNAYRHHTRYFMWILSLICSESSQQLCGSFSLLCRPGNWSSEVPITPCRSSREYRTGPLQRWQPWANLTCTIFNILSIISSGEFDIRNIQIFSFHKLDHMDSLLWAV